MMDRQELWDVMNDRAREVERMEEELVAARLRWAEALAAVDAELESRMV